VAFGYFETLFALRDPIRIESEIKRFKNLNGLLEQVGIVQDIYELFVESTEDILNRIHTAIQNGVQDETFLVEAFNEGYSSDAVITHFRVSNFDELSSVVVLFFSLFLLASVASFDGYKLTLCQVIDQCLDEARPVTVPGIPP
jgi:hypothetical protein